MKLLRGFLCFIVLFFSMSVFVFSGEGENNISLKIILPEEGAIQNAGSGTEIWRGGPENGYEYLVQYAVRVSPYSANSMIRISWKDYESKEGVYHFEKLDRHFQYAIQYGQKLNLACFMTSSRGPVIDGAFCEYPLYVHEAMQKSDRKDVKFEWSYAGKKTGIVRWEPNFENDFFFQRYDALLNAFAKYLDGSITWKGRTVPRKKLVRFIEMRHFGWWGEGAYPDPLVPKNSESLIRFAQSYIKYFPDIRLIVPTNAMRAANVYKPITDYHFFLLTAKNNVGLFGLFRDNFGDDERRYATMFYEKNNLQKDGVFMYELLRDRWKQAPVEGEPMQLPIRKDYHPYTDIVAQAKYLHPVVIRNCNVSVGKGASATNETDYGVKNDPVAMRNFIEMYSILGFRYLVQTPEIVRQNDSLEVSLKWQNIGLTPTYDRWNIRFFILDSDDKEIWQGNSSLDLRTLFPNETLQPGKVDLSKALIHKDIFTPCKVSGALYMQIIDPDGISPPMALSVQGRRADGSYFIGLVK